MEPTPPRKLSYATAIAELLLGADGQKEKLVKEKFESLRKSWALLELYASEGFDEDVLDVIMQKKGQMILSSQSLKDIRELGNPPRPHYDGKDWVVKNYVPEEEMIWWAKASLHRTLGRRARTRYLQLIKEFYGKSSEIIFGNEDKEQP